MSLSLEEREKIAELKRLLPQNFVLHLTTEVRAQIKEVSGNPAQAGLECQLKAALTKLVHDPKFKGLRSHKYNSLNERYGREVWESGEFQDRCRVNFRSALFS